MAVIQGRTRPVRAQVLNVLRTARRGVRAEHFGRGIVDVVAKRIGGHELETVGPSRKDDARSTPGLFP